MHKETRPIVILTLLMSLFIVVGIGLTVHSMRQQVRESKTSIEATTAKIQDANDQINRDIGVIQAATEQINDLTKQVEALTKRLDRLHQETRP